MIIAAVILARSTSSRYPRKHLGDLGGKPMIVRIIDGLREVRQFDKIILATTDKKTDDDLVKVCKNEGILITRGSEENLLERNEQIYFEHEIDYEFAISGDCPFINSEVMRKIALTIRAYPGYDNYSGLQAYSAMPGYLVGARSKRVMEIMRKNYEKHKDKGYTAEQFWLASNEEDMEKLTTRKQVDLSDILPVTVTPMKMSIDWNLERLFWNKVIEYLGYYPETVEDFNKAFGGIKEL